MEWLTDLEIKKKFTLKKSSIIFVSLCEVSNSAIDLMV